MNITKEDLLGFAGQEFANMDHLVQKVINDLNEQLSVLGGDHDGACGALRYQYFRDGQFSHLWLLSRLEKLLEQREEEQQSAEPRLVAARFFEYTCWTYILRVPARASEQWIQDTFYNDEIASMSGWCVHDEYRSELDVLDPNVLGYVFDATKIIDLTERSTKNHHSE